MARLFNDATPDFLERDDPPVTAAPFTVSVWVKSDDATIRQCAVFIGDKDNTTENWKLEIRGDDAGNNVRWRATSGGSSDSAMTATGYTADTWHHICGIEVTSSSRSVYIDGGLSEGDRICITPIETPMPGMPVRT